MKKTLISLLFTVTVFVTQAQNLIFYNMTNNTLECDTSANGGNVWAAPLTVLGTGGLTTDNLPISSQPEYTFHFDESGGLQFDNAAANNFLGSNFSIELYVKIGDQAEGVLVNFSDYLGIDTGFFAWVRNPSAGFSLNRGSNTYDRDNIGTGKYFHYIATRNGANNEVTIYSNGKKVFSQFDNTATCTVHSQGKVGFFADNKLTGWSQGNVAFIGLYDFTLTSAQVLDEYNSIIGNTTGIAAIKANQSLLVYPNPATNKLYLKTEELNTSTDVDITNLSGQVISRQTLMDAHQALNVENLPAGIYILRAKNQSKFFTAKFVKQ